MALLIGWTNSKTLIMRCFYCQLHSAALSRKTRNTAKPNIMSPNCWAHNNYLDDLCGLDNARHGPGFGF